MERVDNRRRFLRDVGAAATVLAAGCLGDGDGGTPTDAGAGGGGGRTDTPTATPTPTPTATPTETPTSTDEAAACAEGETFAAVAGGDWPQHAGNARKTSHNPAAEVAAADLGEAWRRSLARSVFDPMVVGDRVVVNSDADYVYAVDAEDGGTVWAQSGVAHAVRGNTVVVSEGKRLFGFDVERERKRWTYRFEDRPGAFVSATLADGTIYAAYAYDPESENDPCNPFHAVVAVDVQKGTERWSGNFDQVRCGGRTGRTDGPTVAGGRVFVGVENDGLYALDAGDGTPQWRWPLDEPSGTPVATGCSVLFRDGEALLAVDPATGDRRWRVRIDPAAVAADDELAYVTTGEGRVVAVDVTTGAIRWTADAGAATTGTPVAIGPDAVYGVGGGTGPESDVFALAAADGSERWRLPVEGARLDGPALVGARLYVGSEGPGRLYALE
jgi:outer membrane protein assembly factor BamB